MYVASVCFLVWKNAIFSHCRSFIKHLVFKGMKKALGRSVWVTSDVSNVTYIWQYAHIVYLGMTEPSFEFRGSGEAWLIVHIAVY